MVESPAVLHINGRVPEGRNARPIAPVPESRADTRWLSYDELSEMTGMSRDTIVRMARRNKWAKREGNVPGEMRFAVPTSMVVDLQARRPGSPGGAEPKEGQPAAPTVLGAIYQKFMLLEEREDRLEGYLREQMEREYARADSAEAALAKAERRLEKHNQALEAMQVAVAARAAAEAALAAATHRLELMQALAEAERARVAESERAGDARYEALKQDVRLAEERAKALTVECSNARSALEAAAERHAQLLAEAAAEQSRLATVLAEERVRSGAFIEQYNLATSALHDGEARRIAAETALAAVNEQLERTQVAAQAERAHVELVLTGRLDAAETALADTRQQAAAAIGAAAERHELAEAALTAANSQVLALQGECQARAAELAGVAAAHAAELQAQQAQAEAAVAARLQTEAAMAALDARFIQTQTSAMAERTHLEATYATQLAEAGNQMEQARLELERLQAASACQQAELAAALNERSAELASWQEQAKAAREAAEVAAGLRDQALAAMAALTRQVEEAVTTAAHERGELAAAVAEERSNAQRRAAALVEAESRGDRAVAQLEAERVRTKQAIERAAEAEAKLQRQDAARSAGLLTRLLGVLWPGGTGVWPRAARLDRRRPEGFLPSPNS